MLSFSNSPAQWTLSADLGGFVNSIITKVNMIYAGTSTDGVFRSDNNGVNWVQVNSGLTSTFVQCLSSKDNYIFAGTSSGGVYHSSNQGANWVQSNDGISMLNIRALITDNNNVYAGCYFAGVFRSTNNGLNWSRWALGEGDLLYSLSYNETNFFIGLYGGIYRSTNNGVNWMTSHNGLTNVDVRSIVQGVNKTYCATYGGGVFVSDNNGALWTPLSTGLTEMRIVTLASNGTNLLASTYGDGIFYLTNSGTWIQVNDGLGDTLFQTITMNDEYIFAGSSVGNVWRRPLSEIITSIHQSSDLQPVSFRLYQNYPNPFNPGTRIKFDITRDARREMQDVRLIVYDALGKEVERLLDKQLTSGSYEVDFNGSDLPSGIYFYSLSLNGIEADRRKMVLLK